MELVDEILRLARAHENKELVAIDADPATEALLSQLSDRQAGQARVHLKASRAWKTKQNRRARDKMDAAAKALDRLDIVLARGIVRKLDPDVLEPAELERYDELLLAITARAMEIDEIESSLPDEPPDDGDRRSRRFWRR